MDICPAIRWIKFQSIATSFLVAPSPAPPHPSTLPRAVEHFMNTNCYRRRHLLWKFIDFIGTGPIPVTHNPRRTSSEKKYLRRGARDGREPSDRNNTQTSPYYLTKYTLLHPRPRLVCAGCMCTRVWPCANGVCACAYVRVYARIYAQHARCRPVRLDLNLVSVYGN